MLDLTTNLQEFLKLFRAGITDRKTLLKAAFYAFAAGQAATRILLDYLGEPIDGLVMTAEDLESEAAAEQAIVELANEMGEPVPAAAGGLGTTLIVNIAIKLLMRWLEDNLHSEA